MAIETVPANCFHDEVNAREIHCQDALKGRHPLKPPVFIIRTRQIPEPHEYVDKADESLFLQQLGCNRTEGSHKVLPIPCHDLCHSLSHLGFLCTCNALSVEGMTLLIHVFNLLFQSLELGLINTCHPLDDVPPDRLL